MIRLAMVGGLNNYHTWFFGGILNGFAPELWEERPKLKTWSRIPGVSITGCWGENVEEAKTFAEICGVKTVYQNLEDCVGNVDGVIIPDDLTMEHARYAKPFIADKVPLLIDKPLEHRPEEVSELVAAMRRNGNIMTGSALPFHPAIRELKETMSGDNTPLAIQASGPNEPGMPFTFYGMHTLSLVYALMGCGVIEAQNIRDEERQMVLLRYRDGRSAQLLVVNEWVPFSISALSESGRESVVLNDQDFYHYMLSAFVNMVRTGENPISADETDELFKTVFATEESATTGRLVKTGVDQ